MYDVGNIIQVTGDSIRIMLSCNKAKILSEADFIMFNSIFWHMIDMLDDAFQLKALEYVISLLQDKKDSKHMQELNYALDILKERKEQIRVGKEEKMGVA